MQIPAIKCWTCSGAVAIIIALCSGCETGYKWRPREIVKDIPTPQLAQSVTTSKPAPDNLVFSLPGGIPLEMVGIGEGTFVMGVPLPESGNVDKTLRGNSEIGHKVTLTNPYWIGKYEVTQEQYESLMGHHSFTNIGPRLPADSLSWHDARAFTDKLNEVLSEELPEGYLFDLPTEAQWEYACKAGTITTFNNGKGCELEPKMLAGMRCMEFCEVSPSLDEVGWYGANAGGTTHEVGQKKPNAWGLYDMHGNVFEWCLDCYDRFYGSPEVPDQFKMPSHLLNFIDPAVLNQNTVSLWSERQRGYRIIKGGGYKQAPDKSTSYSRMGMNPNAAKFGMRVALVKYSLPAVDSSDNTVYGLDPTIQQLAINIKRMNDTHVTIRRLEMLQTALQVAEGVTDVAIQAYFDRKEQKRVAKSGIGGESSTGFGTIKGPNSLSYDFNHKNGQTARYSLYVGGKNVSANASWSSAGTSLDVSSSGRAMARNPPVDRGRTFKTGIKAVYNGKTYTKTITILKR